MSSTASVLYCYEAAQACEKDGDFLAAARNYFECHLYYENAELTVSYEFVQRYGLSSLGKYYHCIKKMTPEDKAKIRADEIAMSFLSDWEDKVNYLEVAFQLERGEDDQSFHNDKIDKAIEKTMIFTGKVCPYCGKKTELVDSAEVYGGRSFGPIYICRDCDAYVGCYKGTTTALGRLADKDLRRAKRRAHHYLDQLWKKPEQRIKVYEWISQELHIPKPQTHIGMSDVNQCNRIANLCRNRLIARRKHFPFRRFKEWREDSE